MKHKWIIIGVFASLILCLAFIGAVYWGIKNFKVVPASALPENQINIKNFDIGDTGKFKVQILNSFITKKDSPTECEPDISDGEYVITVAFTLERSSASSDNKFINIQLISPNNVSYDVNFGSSFLYCTTGIPNSFFETQPWITGDELVYGAQHRYVVQYIISSKEFDETEADWSLELSLDKKIIISLPKENFLPYKTGRDFVNSPNIQEIYK